MWLHYDKAFCVEIHNYDRPITGIKYKMNCCGIRVWFLAGYRYVSLCDQPKSEPSVFDSQANLVLFLWSKKDEGLSDLALFIMAWISN